MCFASSTGILFTAQPEAPASVLACASGWAVNDKMISPMAFGWFRWGSEITGR
jgi:hypothetical protein